MKIKECQIELLSDFVFINHIDNIRKAMSLNDYKLTNEEFYNECCKHRNYAILSHIDRYFIIPENLIDTVKLSNINCHYIYAKKQYYISCTDEIAQIMFMPKFEKFKIDRLEALNIEEFWLSKNIYYTFHITTNYLGYFEFIRDFEKGNINVITTNDNIYPIEDGITTMYQYNLFHILLKLYNKIGNWLYKHSQIITIKPLYSPVNFVCTTTLKEWMYMLNKHSAYNEGTRLSIKSILKDEGWIL